MVDIIFPWPGLNRVNGSNKIGVGVGDGVEALPHGSDSTASLRRGCELTTWRHFAVVAHRSFSLCSVHSVQGAIS